MRFGGEGSAHPMGTECASDKSGAFKFDELEKSHPHR
jgi:hypothetical protein